MRTYKTRSGIKKTNKAGSRKALLWFFLACFFILFLWDVAGPYGLWKLHRIKQQRRVLYARVIEASKENAFLKNRITSFQKDRHVQEQEVRNRLGWVKKDEVIYKFMD